MTQPTAEQSTFRSCWYASAALCVGQAIALGAHEFSAAALVLIGVAIVLMVAGVAWEGPAVPEIAVRLIAAAAVAGGFARLAIDDAFVRDPNARALLVPFEVMAAVAGILAAGVFFVARSRSALLACFLLLVGVHGVMALMAVSARVPGIDVYDVQMLGCDALRHGRNPFAITFPDRYGPDAGYYPPGVVVDGTVQCGYFYPPLSLLLDFPAYLVGDVRYAHVAAITFSAMLLGFLRPGRTGRETLVPATMLLFSPRIFYQLQVGWIEPFVVLTLCATVFCAARGWPIATAAMLGLFCASKQYAFFAALAALLLLIPRPWTVREIARWALIAAAAACAVTLPFVLWDPPAFFRSMTVLYGGVFRNDSISFLPGIANATGLKPSLTFSAIAAIPPIALTLWRAPRSVCGFAASSALILLCVFAFSAQAFGNYYLVVIAALCAALAAQETRPASGAAK
jgi:hypothetical protein